MRRVTAIIALAAFGLSHGCSTLKGVPIEEVQPSERVVTVTYRTGELVQFDEEGAIVNTYRGTIDGTRVDGVVVGIPIKDVVAVEAKRTDTTRTIVYTTLTIGAIVGAVAGIIVLARD